MATLNDPRFSKCILQIIHAYDNGSNRKEASTLKSDSSMDIRRQLGAGPLEERYVRANTRFLLSLRNATILQSQQQLKIPGSDAGLTAEVQAYHERLRSEARGFINSVWVSYIQAITGGKGFTNLAGVTLSPGQGLSKALVGANGSVPQAAIDISVALAEQADQMRVTMRSLDFRVKVFRESITEFHGPYLEVVSKAIESMGLNAEKHSKEIDRLRKEIDTALDEVTDGFSSVGQAVTDLGTGVVTIITGQPKAEKPKDDGADDKKSKDADAAGDDKAETSLRDKKAGSEDTPSAKFVVEAIRAGRTGMERGTKALSSLERLNDRQAEAYQALASLSVYTAVAKVIATQSRFFFDTLENLAKATVELKEAWGDTGADFQELAELMVANKVDPTAVSRALPSAHAEWKALQETLVQAQDSVISING